MAVLERGVDQKAEHFLTSEGFESLCLGMDIINTLSISETVGGLAQVVTENFVVNWSKGGKGSLGMSIARLKDIKAEDQMRNRGYPQLNIEKSRAPEQITIHTGEKTLSTFRFPAHQVVENSNRLLAAKIETVSRQYGLVSATMIDAILVSVEYGGGIKLFERMYGGKWDLKNDLSEILEKNVNHLALFSALANVS